MGMGGTSLATTGSGPRPQSGDVDAFGLTHPGKQRRENQDQFLIASLHKLLKVHQSSLPADGITQLVTESRGFLFVVADGVGGRPDGAGASGTAVRTVAHYVTHLTDLYRRLDSDKEAVFLAELEASAWKSHEVLRAQGDREYEGRGGATTLTMVAVLWPRAYLVQVGDSRCYRLRDGKLELLTQDHTWVNEQVVAGFLSKEQARAHPLKNVVTRALGGESDVLVDVREVEVRSGDLFLLCSDGLTGMLSDADILDCMSSGGSLHEICRALITDSNARGGMDNVTVVLLSVEDEGAGEAGEEPR
jgi:protein phosphatase